MQFVSVQKFCIPLGAAPSGGKGFCANALIVDVKNNVTQIRVVYLIINLLLNWFFNGRGP